MELWSSQIGYGTKKDSLIFEKHHRICETIMHIMVHGSFISHYLHNINIERKV